LAQVPLLSFVDKMMRALQLCISLHLAQGDHCAVEMSVLLPAEQTSVLLQKWLLNQKALIGLNDDKDTACDLNNVSFPNYDDPVVPPPHEDMLGHKLSSPILLQDVVKKVFYINMDNSTDRRIHMEDMLSKLQRESGIPYERVRALLPEEDPWVEQKQSIPNDQKARLWGGKRPGGMSCFSNHLRALRQALNLLKSNVGQYGLEGFVMVLEDDALLNSTSLKKVTAALADVPSDVQMLLLGWWGTPRPQDSLTAKKTVYRVGGRRDPASGKMRLNYGGTHAYLVRNVYLEQVINFMDATPMGYSADGGMLFHPQCLRKYALNPPLVDLQHSLSSKSERLYVEKQYDARHARKS